MSTRRDFLALGAGAVATTSVLPLAAKSEPASPTIQQAHPDAAILAVCVTFMDAHLQYKALDHASDVTDEEVNRLFDLWHDGLDIVTETRARTRDGLKAKARAMIAAFEIGVERDFGGTIGETGRYHELLAWRLAHDMLLACPS